MRFMMTLLPLAALAACATPIPPSKTAEDLSAAQTEFGRLNALATTIPAPAGTASYEGEIGASLSIDGDGSGSFLGELSLEVDFEDTTAGVTGSIDKITVYDDGVPDQDLGGSLAVAGAYDGGLSATATGTLSAVGSEGGFSLKGETDVALTLSGSLIDDGGTDTMIGTFTGGSTGDGDFDVSVTGGTSFYAK